MFVNNPSLVAYSEVRSMTFKNIEHAPSAKDMMLVSIGTGSVSKGYEYKKPKIGVPLDGLNPL